MKKIIGYIFSFIVFISMYGGAMLFCGYQKELIIDPIIVDIVVSITIILTTIITCAIIGFILYLTGDRNCHPIESQCNKIQ